MACRRMLVACIAVVPEHMFCDIVKNTDTDRQTDRQTHTEIQTDRQIGKQTDTCRHRREHAVSPDALEMTARHPG